MLTRGSAKASVYTNVGVHADVEITLTVERRSAAINVGHDGPDLVLDFADAESLERLAAVAAEGARQLRAMTE